MRRLKLSACLLCAAILFTACGGAARELPASPSTAVGQLFGQAAPGSHSFWDNFTGAWHRTDTSEAFVGTIEIKNQTDTSFDFSFVGFYGGNQGPIGGTAVRTGVNTAEFQYVSTYDSTADADVDFALEGDGLHVKSVSGDGTIPAYALGFGNGVFIDGEYTKSDPVYTNADLADEILPCSAIKERMRLLLGQDVYDRMLMVFQYGIRFPDDGLTYRGFIDGSGEGVDLLITDDEIYCLAYGLDSDGLIYKLYTNDANYQDTLPPFMHIDRPDYTLKFVYRALG